MMASPSANSAPTPLPQYGFGAETDFDSLIATNHFVFRVYTPKQKSPFSDDSDPFFVAPKFDERYTLSPKQLSAGNVFDRIPVSQSGTYEDAAKHMDWTTRASSAYISTSFSFIWSIWEALRRYHQGIKKDVQIAVINASALAGRAATAVQLLRKCEATDRTREYWKRYRFAQESQSVLVHEYIPGSAVFASIPLLSLLERLPSYFLRPEASPLRGTPLASIAWDYREKKPNFRHFCQQMSDSFLQSSPDVRLRDTTAASVRLAAAFLRPWFHQMVSNDFDIATATLRDLSFLIAQWPGQWWARDHTEMWDLIRTMVLALAEEVREKQRLQTEAEVTRLQESVDQLEGVVKQYQEEVARHDPAPVFTPQISCPFPVPDQTLSSEPQAPLLARRSLVITIPTNSDGSYAPPSPLVPEIFSGRCRPIRNSLGSEADSHDLFSMPRPGPGIDSGLIPTIPLRFPSPEILSSRSTPHLPFSLPISVSPVVSTSPLPPSPKVCSPPTGVPPTPPPEAIETSQTAPPAPFSRSVSPVRSTEEIPTETEDDEVTLVDIFPSAELDALFSHRSRASKATDLPSLGGSLAKTIYSTEDITHPPEAEIPPVYPQPIQHSSVLSSAKTPLATENPLEETTAKEDDVVRPEPRTPRAMRAVPLPSVELPIEETSWRSPWAVEAASCIFTGFLVGAFITLCIFSPQRRTLITHLT